VYWVPVFAATRYEIEIQDENFGTPVKKRGWGGEGGTKLVFSPKLVCTKVSTLVLDLPYLGLHCSAAHFLH